MADSILVSRLWEFYGQDFDPWEEDFSMEMIGEGESLQESPFLPPEDLWSAEEHAARIRYLAQTPEALDNPIEIDNYCDTGYVYAEPVILDGHHRLAAHVWLKRKWIKVLYGGREDLLEFLKGNTEDLPE